MRLGAGGKLAHGPSVLGRRSDVPMGVTLRPTAWNLTALVLEP